MRIRLKLSIVELTMAFGFIIAISISLFYLNSMVRVKNMEFQAERVVSGLNRFSNKTEDLLVTNKKLSVLMDDWYNSVLDFENELKLLKESKAVKILGKERISELSEVENWWKQVSDWQVQPLLKYMQTMVSNGFDEKFGDKGILQSYYAGTNRDSELIGPVLSLTNYKKNVQESTVSFAEKQNNFIVGLRTQSELFIKNSLRIVIVLVFVTIIISLIVINLFARRISNRIGLVDDAVQTLTGGDFSKNLKINSKDEFEELANHYNTLKGELWKKLDSILEFMLQIGEGLSEGVDINSSLKSILDSFVKNTTADAGAVFMVDEDQQFIDLISLNGFFPCPFAVPQEVLKSREAQTDYLKRHPISIGKTIIGKAIKSGKGVYLKEAGRDEMLRQNNLKDSVQYIHSIAVVPLIISKRVLGAVALVRTSPDMSFTDLEFTNMKTFGDYAALSIDNMYNFTEAVQLKEMQRELAIASDIQKNLLPRKLPEIKRYDIAVHTEAARAMSGDYYDIYRLDKERIALVICDVVGRGVPASLLMVMIRTVIRFVSSPKRGAEDILNVLNKGLTRRIGTDQYATISITVINEKTGQIDFSNAGHSPLLYYSENKKEFSTIDTMGLPVGVEAKETYLKKTVGMNSNDIFVLYTDGLPEAKGIDGSLYSIGKMENLIISNKEKSSEQIIETVKNDMKLFKGSMDLVDDQTLIVVKAK